MLKKLAFSGAFFMVASLAHAQFLMDMVDTTKDMGKSMLAIYKKFDHIRISGYLQPQFQAAGEKGAKSFNGGDFPATSDNRFMLRRGRLRFDYIHFSSQKGPSIQFVFQFDGTERGVFIRDFWGRLLENKYQLFSFSVGMFARPFSYELNLSSSDRESPERGRMSQLLMKTERDLGAMISFEPRRKDHPLRYLKLDAGLFNGPGLASTTDFDSHKDFISRLALKPWPLSRSLTLSAAVSYLNGGLLQYNKYLNRMGTNASGKTFVTDSAETNAGKIAPRDYFGGDFQLKYKHRFGYTELRGEFISGTQTGTAASSETPAALVTTTDGLYIRQFYGAYFYFLQNLFNPHHQLCVKYDWYDPNIDVKNEEIGKAGTRFTAADIKYSTLGLGYIYYMNDNLKLVLWYDRVRNEKTLLPGYTRDLKDDIFTCRIQFRF